jgi:Sel1 repeat
MARMMLKARTLSAALRRTPRPRRRSPPKSKPAHIEPVVAAARNFEPSSATRRALNNPLIPPEQHKVAADQGEVKAQAVLGTMYANGQGVPQDYVQAHMWYNLAASRENDATFRDDEAKVRDELAAKMTPDQIAEARRMAREWKPK